MKHLPNGVEKLTKTFNKIEFKCHLLFIGDILIIIDFRHMLRICYICH